jgi:effector-binding domain-containing protein
VAHTVEIERVRATTAVVTRFHVAPAEGDAVGERMGQAFTAVASGLTKAGIVVEGPALAYYRPTPDHGFDVAAGFVVGAPFTVPPGLDRLDLDAGEVAHTTHLGPYSDLPAAYADLHDAVTARGRTLSETGPMWEEYWSAPGTPEEDTRTEVYWPVSEAGAP